MSDVLEPSPEVGALEWLAKAAAAVEVAGDVFARRVHSYEDARATAIALGLPREVIAVVDGFVRRAHPVGAIVPLGSFAPPPFRCR